MTTLLQLPYSPWSERARWALDARGIDYRRRHYQPLIGEPELRWRLGRWRGPVSVPVLITDRGPVADSWSIARWADARGDGPSLFPHGSLPEIERWDRLAERGLSAGRALSLRRVAATPAALDELTPPFLRGAGAAARAITRAGVLRTLRKYDASEPAVATQTLASTLDELRAGLRGATLRGAFSYADITMAQVLAFVHPPPDRWLRAGPENRALFGDASLAARYSDLVAWRDALYAAHRG